MPHVEANNSPVNAIGCRIICAMLVVALLTSSGIAFGWQNNGQNEEFRARFGTTTNDPAPANGVNAQPAGQPATNPPGVVANQTPAVQQTQQTQQPNKLTTTKTQQTQQTQNQSGANTGERRTELNDSVGSMWQQASGSPSASTESGTETPREITRVSQTFESLPSGAGQVWREYDIQPYTSQITGTDRPEQAVTEWLLRQTGKEMWFQEPFGFMNASRDKLFVYHTPEIHNQIRPLLDRMIVSRGQPQILELGLYTVANPNWRAAAVGAMQPIQVSSPGVEAWVTSKENAARIISQIQSRGDFKSHASGRAIIHNGQKFELERRTPEQFIRSIQWTPGQGAGYQPLLTQFNEGYSVSISPLTTLDSRNIEVVVKCEVDQIEKQTSVAIPLTDTAGLNQKINLQVPQIVSWRLEERVLWPVDQVLVLGCGVVALPNGSGGNKPLGGLFEPNSGRADALLFIDYRGPSAERPNGTSVANGMTPIRK